MKIARIDLENWKSFAATGQLHLGAVNVLVGRNNSGKSAILRAVHLMQQGSAISPEDVRIGKSVARVNIILEGDHLAGDVNRYFGDSNITTNEPLPLSFMIGKPRNPDIGIEFNRKFDSSRTNAEPAFISAEEPNNFIYTYFSKRKVFGFEEQVNRQNTVRVGTDLRFLVSKVNRLAASDYEGHDEYEKLCNEVLGFRVGTFASRNGSQAGIAIGRHDRIPLEAMGEGVSSMLGLITDLCMADGHLFLIEEPENDIHPESLKALLKAIADKSTSNQFIVTTHSNIVTRYLGAAESSKVFEVQSNYQRGQVPSSTIREIEKTPEARIEVLRSLGYELSDFDLWDGWIILEESSAEMVISYLIRWFVPRLARVRTVSANGVTKALPTFEDFRRLFLFAHLEKHYQGRAWVVLDGDEPGKDVVGQLQQKYRGWPSVNFRTWTHGDFENYYPERFAERAGEVLALSQKEKRNAKIALTREVRAWIDQNPDAAKDEFEESAAEVIAFLCEVDERLFD
ncbi:ATP-dependent endonuclease [Streptomyces mirabilis]|uniref:ATP-dependent nuclease n=1 Tax=Streptomyces mirabilis TaxID=68239 RepID=UPI0036CDF6C1